MTNPNEAVRLVHPDTGRTHVTCRSAWEAKYAPAGWLIADDDLTPENSPPDPDDEEL